MSMRCRNAIVASSDQVGMHGLAALVEALHAGDGLLRDEEDVLAHRTADGVTTTAGAPFR